MADLLFGLCPDRVYQARPRVWIDDAIHHAADLRTDPLACRWPSEECPIGIRFRFNHLEILIPMEASEYDIRIAVYKCLPEFRYGPAWIQSEQIYADTFTEASREV